MERFIHVEHGFGPCYAADSTRLFLGTMASPKSREAGFFYMHPRNRFWTIMQALFADPQDASDVVGDTPDSRRAFALRHRFALWDTVESCEHPQRRAQRLERDHSQFTDLAYLRVRAEGGPAVPQIQRADARVQWHPCI